MISNNIKHSIAIFVLALSAAVVQAQELAAVSGIVPSGIVNAPLLGGGLALLTGTGARFLNGDPLQTIGGLGGLGLSALNPEVPLSLLTGTVLPLLGVVSPTLSGALANPTTIISVLLHDGGLLAPGTASLPAIPLINLPLLDAFAVLGV